MSDFELVVNNPSDKYVTVSLKIGKTEKEYVVEPHTIVTQSATLRGTGYSMGCATLPILLILIGILAQFV